MTTPTSPASIAESILQWAAQKRDHHLIEAIADNGWPTDHDYIEGHITMTYCSGTGISEWSHDGVPFLEEETTIGTLQLMQTFRRITQ